MKNKYPPSLARIIGAGFVSTLVMTLIWYFPARSSGVPVFDFAAFIGNFFTANTAAPWTRAWVLGLLEHFLNGTIIFPLVYTYLFFPKVHQYPFAKGAVWGLLLFIATQLIIAPVMGMGPFFVNAPNPVLAWFITFNANLIYGVLLGGIIGGEPAEENRVVERPEFDRAA